MHRWTPSCSPARSWSWRTPWSPTSTSSTSCTGWPHAASPGLAGLVELFQIQKDQGACLDCFRTGRPVTAADLRGPGQPWPQFAAAATGAGFRTVQAVPMLLRDEVIGALNLFGTGTVPLSPGDVRIGQALADVATIGLRPISRHPPAGH